jgi:hypothetical protein
VVYNGDANFQLSSSTPLSEVIKAPSGTALALTAGSSPSNAGDSLTFTATVVPGFGSSTPTGTVTFTDAFDSSTLGGGPITLNGSGQASVTTSSLAAGIHHITATYSGDVNFIGSTSLAVTQVVIAATGSSSTTALTVNGGSSATLYFGFVAGVAQSASFVITVTGTNVQDGDSVVLMQGAVTVGPVLTLSAGQAKFKSQLGAGVHSIQAVYIGSGTSAGGISSAVTVNRSPGPRLHP